ncbi:hypothetical protein H5410_031790 [Solanum commersonii]|uniref:Uncharacterized protein n=1 Tax=Solanum commersonii TaxID=4109 RepID=A0A9J5YMR0_SOLCO|nr:hypothetical protein H5410_031790 [Solanum commersonii]
MKPYPTIFTSKKPATWKIVKKERKMAKVVEEIRKKRNRNLSEAINHFKDKVASWSNITFGDFPHKKERILARLGGIQKSHSYPYSVFLPELEKDLLNDYNYILRIEEDHWKMRSRINWLTDRDANTKFFQLSVINRRRWNKISFFKDEQGNWFDDHNQILSHTSSYFQQIYQSDHLSSNWKDICYSPKSSHNLDLITLDRPLHNLEDSQFFRKTRSPGISNKSWTICEAGRLTLIKSTLDAIPVHIMQYFILPKRICKDIDKIQRECLWGSTTQKKKLHYINWDLVTKPKRNRGLGISKSLDINLASIASLSWRLFPNYKSLWACTLINKYAWSPGSGKIIDFWKHSWIPDTPTIRTLVQGPLNYKENVVKLSNIWNNGIWNWDNLSLAIPNEIN